ncbi:CRISPR-associated endonuclease Cas1 [Kineosporia sp. J2-2]|uniref:CRISPR-associated endonuclease Cas1 n=1 Tax=Kineosporia corallincola TaxID=2835133 RepID=A0ABS5TTN0_9ACTN|nr:CRISPR-associated endonuclease Cas1 [Kineosporia corallincola]MBT0774162.1 CRISPR-associated endonuclease Cas1 [Kineosporia corallincola]
MDHLMAADGEKTSEPPALVPARMVNEFIYCPRLFHLEWVQSRFAISDDVEEGLYVHRVVDEASSDLPDPDEHLERFAGRKSRSFWLSSTELGLTAKLDIAEVDSAGLVVPVDYKKGAPDPHGKVWDTDRIQSLIQALLLRDAGYPVEQAEVWYNETRQRMTIDITDQTLSEVREVLIHLHEVASDPQPPRPLINSPKCPRCSLVGICMPDEITTLRPHEKPRPRRLLAADPDNRPVYVQEQGTVVGVRRGRLEVFKEGQTLASYRLIDVSQLCLQGNITVSPQAVRELMAREIPICWFSYGGWFAGMAQGLPGKNIDLRKSQFTITSEQQTAIASRMIEAKIRNGRTLLRRNSRNLPEHAPGQLLDLAKQAAEATAAPSLLGLEGAAARIYFSHFTSMFIPDPPVQTDRFDTNGRARRPPPDPVNALLSFLYSLLVKDITATLTMIGFDPYYGVYHRPRFGRPALSLDLAEEFRPIVADATVIQLVNNREIRAHHFLQKAGACQLTADGRKAVIGCYERRMAHEIKHPTFGYRVTYRRALDVQARILAAHLTGEIPEYTPFTTR